MRRPLDRQTLMSRDPYFAPHRSDDEPAGASSREAPEPSGYLTRIPVRSVNRIVIQLNLPPSENGGPNTHTWPISKSTVARRHKEGRFSCSSRANVKNCRTVCY